MRRMLLGVTEVGHWPLCPTKSQTQLPTEMQHIFTRSLAQS